ncbi:MAG: aminomethyl-transferring glycine dehydrogenase subunit GcvPB [Opitutales bacterium]|jgi:glycine dehydrogenase
MAKLPFDPSRLPRELARHYVPAGDKDIREMFAAVGSKDFPELYSHIDPAVLFRTAPDLPEELSYEALADSMEELSRRNNVRTAFLGDGLQAYRVHEIVGHVCSIRNLTTSYTPYQPERSQGTLITHWLYQSAMSQLTGFEAVNSSLYDRASALFEAAVCAVRMGDAEANTVLVAGNLLPADLEVLRTHVEGTSVRIEVLRPDDDTGRIAAGSVRDAAARLGRSLAAFIFPQVNALGLLEDVDALTDACADAGIRAVAVVDPMLLATGGLKPPSAYGRRGADIVVGEGQHLAIGPNFGGPGLGLFAVRHNAEKKNEVRETPGRFVGKAKDGSGRDCIVMVMSTREQHIRKDKATSNICSNQAFIATIAGAAVLARGEKGMADACAAGRDLAHRAAARLHAVPGLRVCYAKESFWNEFCLILPESAAAVIAKGRAAGLHVGVDVTGRTPCGCHLLKVSFSDVQSVADCDRLVAFFEGLYGKAGAPAALPAVPSKLLRDGPVGLPSFGLAELKDYYLRLGELNVSPDTGCFPLGSCTMKYNPHVNDWAAGLPGFTGLHPQAPAEDAQGSLALLWEIQEWFRKITGLAGLTTQPVAGAQGELVGLKLFQAYHRAKGENRDILLIPATAHGTNFATATTAGYATGRRADGSPTGIVILKALPDGRVDQADFDAKIAEHGPRIAGMMVTNPNTSGVFETDFRRMAEAVHRVGGLVYMDGANMNAIAGWVDLGALGVDAVHNNLHKTWTVPHGGGGPGDGIVAVSERLVEFLPGFQVEKQDGRFVPVRPRRSIGSFHRHWGNFAHKVRVLTYLRRLGKEGVRRMAAMSVLSSRYLHSRLGSHFPSLPAGAEGVPRMHEFILTLTEEDFRRAEAAGVPRASVIARVGKLFLDFGFHAPTVAFPEVFGLMIEPTESYTKAELDRFAEAVIAIGALIREKPEVLKSAPRFTPVDRVDEVAANRNLTLSERITVLPSLNPNRIPPAQLAAMPVEEIRRRILAEV